MEVTFSNYSPGVKNGLAPWTTWSYSCLFCFCVCGMAELLLEKPNLYIFSFVEIDHEIFSTVILSLPLIQEGQLSVSGKRMCTILVNCLE